MDGDMGLIDTSLYEQILVFSTGENMLHAVPLEAVASWGELLGVTDEQALALILDGYEPPVQTDDPEDNGWTRLYDTLIDRVQTEVMVQRTAGGGVATGGDIATEAWLGTVGRFGPDLVMAHVEALTEDAHRMALAGAQVEVPEVVRQVLPAITDDVAALRRDFRGRFNPYAEGDE